MGQPTERERQEAYVRRWKTLGPILESIRDREIRQADTAASIRSMDQAYRIALRDLPPRSSSGLVEWQRYMALWRKRG
jgi:hypothetical protein